MKKKILSLIFALITAAVCALGLTACGGNEPPAPPAHTQHSWSQAWTSENGFHWHACSGCSEKKDYAAHDFSNGDCICGEKAPVQSLSLEKLISDYPEETKSFFEEFLKPKAVEGKEGVTAEGWFLQDSNSDGKIDGATLSFVCSTGKTTRALIVAILALSAPVSAKDVAGEKVASVSATVSLQTVFEFDAKVNYDSQDILNALYAADNNATSTIKVYKEVESSNSAYRSFDIVKASDTQISVDNIMVEKGDGSKADLLYLLDTHYGHEEETKSTVDIGGANIYSTSYALENLGGSTIDPDKPVVESDVAKALNDNCKEALVNRCLLGFTDISLDKVSNGTWRTTKDADGNFTSAEYAFNYADASNSHYYTVGKVVFDSPVSVKDLQDGNLGNTTYSRAYRTNYNPEIQSAREELTTAICETVFGMNNTATRFIVDNGDDTATGLGSIRRFKVIEITDKGVEEVSINIKSSLNDDGYIEKLEDESNYEITATDGYTFKGQIVHEKTA